MGNFYKYIMCVIWNVLKFQYHRSTLLTRNRILKNICRSRLDFHSSDIKVWSVIKSCRWVHQQISIKMAFLSSLLCFMTVSVNLLVISYRSTGFHFYRRIVGMKISPLLQDVQQWRIFACSTRNFASFVNCLMIISIIIFVHRSGILKWSARIQSKRESYLMKSFCDKYIWM